jgi:hypothetical protein
MIACFMAFSTGKIISSHVNIAASVRLKKLPGHVGMLYGIPTSSVKVAGTASGTAGVPHIFRNFF